MVRYLQITGWQKHRGHHTLSFSETQHSVDRLIILTVTLLTTNHSAAFTPTAATIYTPLIIYLVLQAAENMSNTLIHLYLYFWPLKVQYVRLWSFWHHCTVLMMFLMIQFSVVCCFSALMLFLGEYFHWCVTAAHLVERVNSAWTQEGFAAHVILPPNLTTVLSD